MEEAVTSILLGDAPLAALVGTRIHWLYTPQDVEVFPYVNLQKVSGGAGYNMTAPDGLHTSRLQADTWAETYGSAKAVSRVVLAALSAFSGTVAGTVVQGVFLDNERDLRGDDVGAVTRLHRVSQDFIVWHD